ncbi:MAG: RNA polymerase sigma factor [Gemmatimonadetes bacterium]|nr:RNA polymerase sigma factor [Gemmatimonadota bacterium]
MSASAAAAREEPLAAWMGRYGGELRAHLRRFVGPDDAEDLLQEVWLTAHRRPPDAGEGSNVRAWLYRVATRAALDHVSRRDRRRRLLDSGADRLVDEPPTSADPAAAEETRRRVREAIARLPRKQREAVWLRWIDGLSYEEVAERLACSPESARANVYQALKRLRSDLAELLNEEDR